MLSEQRERYFAGGAKYSMLHSHGSRLPVKSGQSGTAAPGTGALLILPPFHDRLQRGRGRRHRPTMTTSPLRAAVYVVLAILPPPHRLTCVLAPEGSPPPVPLRGKRPRNLTCFGEYIRGFGENAFISAANPPPQRRVCR